LISNNGYEKYHELNEVDLTGQNTGVLRLFQPVLLATQIFGGLFLFLYTVLEGIYERRKGVKTI